MIALKEKKALEELEESKDEPKVIEIIPEEEEKKQPPKKEDI